MDIQLLPKPLMCYNIRNVMFVWLKVFLFGKKALWDLFRNLHFLTFFVKEKENVIFGELSTVCLSVCLSVCLCLCPCVCLWPCIRGWFYKKLSSKPHSPEIWSSDGHSLVRGVNEIFPVIDIFLDWWGVICCRGSLHLMLLYICKFVKIGGWQHCFI